jgi:hypothetical protein
LEGEPPYDVDQVVGLRRAGLSKAEIGREIGVEWYRVSAILMHKAGERELAQENRADRRDDRRESLRNGVRNVLLGLAAFAVLIGGAMIWDKVSPSCASTNSCPVSPSTRPIPKDCQKAARVDDGGGAFEACMELHYR